jgi:hypothetical protein
MRGGAPAAHEVCSGIIRHERCCIAVDPLVAYAYKIFGDSKKLLISDALILHSLGVSLDLSLRSQRLTDLPMRWRLNLRHIQMLASLRGRRCYAHRCTAFHWWLLAL